MTDESNSKNTDGQNECIKDDKTGFCRSVRFYSHPFPFFGLTNGFVNPDDFSLRLPFPVGIHYLNLQMTQLATGEYLKSLSTGITNLKSEDKKITIR